MNSATQSRLGKLGVRQHRWGNNWFWESRTIDGRWLSLYLLTLAIGLLGDLASCELSPLPAFWAQVLPSLDYIGIVFVGITLGAGGGLAAATVAGISHGTITAVSCADATSQHGQLLMFGAVGLLCGWIAKHGGDIRIEPKSVPASPQERSGDSPLSELGRLLPGLVHQFRTPIASIEGAGSVLEDTELSEDKRREFVGIVHKECRRLNLLVGLLDFTQSRTSDYREVDVPRMLDDVIEQCGSKRGESIIALRSAAWPDLPRLRCDPELIKQALVNLTTNAIHAMPKGGELVLWARSADSEMIIGVTDQRVDNRVEYLHRLFDAASISYERSEVDLAIVQQIVSRHRGTIRIEPNTGRGLTISLIIPLGQ